MSFPRASRASAMEKVAVFGNAGAGKSTLAKRLSAITGLPLYPLDTIQFRAGRYRPEEKDGGKVPHEEYLKIHADLLKQDRWIIDGYDSVASAWEWFDAADTLVYIDLPLLTHYRWITKRLVKGLFRNPEGWPENSPIWSSTLSSYRVLWPCHRRVSPEEHALCGDVASCQSGDPVLVPAEAQRTSP